MINMPIMHDFGFGKVTEVSYLEQVLGITRRSALKYLKVLHIEPFYFGSEVFFSLITFQRIMFVLSKPGAKGFAFPGSTKKANRRAGQITDILYEVTDEILEQAADPKVLSEMAGCSGDDPAILKKFVTKPVGRPKKEKDEKVT